jgi:hypothetical protein
MRSLVDGCVKKTQPILEITPANALNFSRHDCSLQPSFINLSLDKTQDASAGRPGWRSTISLRLHFDRAGWQVVMSALAHSPQH